MIIGKTSCVRVLKELELIDSDFETRQNLGPHLEQFQSLGQALPKEKHDHALLFDDVFAELKTELESVFPWFLENMPTLYHWITPHSQQMDHVVTIVSGKVLSLQQIAERGNALTRMTTLIAPGENGSAIVSLSARLNKFQNAKSINIFSSLDTRIAIASVYESRYQPVSEANPTELIEKRANLLKALSSKSEKQVDSFLQYLDVDHLRQATVLMLVTAFEALEHCKDNENSYVHLTDLAEVTEEIRFRVDIGLKGFPVTAAVENVVGIFTRYNFTIRRVLATEIKSANKQDIAVLQVIASQANGAKLDLANPAWGRTLKGLKTLSYVDNGDEFSNLLLGQNPKSLNETNLIRAIANWTHIFLTKENSYYYTLDRVSKFLVRNESFMDLAISYFRARFDPRFNGDRLKTSIELTRVIQNNINEVSDEIERNILKESLNFLKSILKTNYFLVSKGALTFRVSSEVLNKKHYPDQPFGIFFMIGRDFRGFQVRYRDIARGGVRVVMPRSDADYEAALAGLFDEVNGLASAQQLKNKDIPEGGSKCVFVLRPGGNRDLAVKSAISGLLDLITLDPDTQALNPAIIDEYGKEEIIYLGPDENMTDDLIVWTIEHALHRKYKYAYAFMSSKPDFGINHKTYGVTSEGVNVYLDNVLKYLKWDSTKDFRVKMTGGPDGDVAGNELKILHREYGERARVVAVADGYGAAYDPKGLNWSELLRLVKESKSIVEFNRDYLSKDAESFVIVADKKENIKRRDSLYAQVEAEVFIPAGGRPYTVRESNWRNFLKPDGTPSALAIVEGANIFFTNEARKNLVESGVVVIKDSSANKAGVICSSFEIIACLTLSPDEFAQIKPDYVKQVVDILKEKADAEAKLLFQEWQKRKSETDLVELSCDISKEINLVTDVVSEHLNKLSDQELAAEKFNFIIYQHCPEILVDKYKERILERLPRAHKIAIMSAYMASHLIYKEGLNWVEFLEPSRIYKIALEYVNAERRVERMIQNVKLSELQEKDALISILRTAGPRHLASTFL